MIKLIPCYVNLSLSEKITRYESLINSMNMENKKNEKNY